VLHVITQPNHAYVPSMDLCTSTLFLFQQVDLAPVVKASSLSLSLMVCLLLSSGMATLVLKCNKNNYD
jgi:hypothetical protein